MAFFWTFHVFGSCFIMLAVILVSDFFSPLTFSNGISSINEASVRGHNQSGQHLSGWRGYDPDTGVPTHENGSHGKERVRRQFDSVHSMPAHTTHEHAISQRWEWLCTCKTKCVISLTVFTQHMTTQYTISWIWEWLALERTGVSSLWQCLLNMWQQNITQHTIS